MASSTKYLVAIATYSRPSDLEHLLDSLLTSVDLDSVDVVVVDNDASASAEQVVLRHPLKPRYEVEPVPGIASARNRALDLFDSRYAGIIFVDDDEWVDPSWYRQIVSYADSTGAQAVQGPVVSVLPEDAPAWVRRGNFFQRLTEETGSELKSAATNNVLLMRTAWVGAGLPRFDIAFSETGGSDFDFFWGIRKSGAKILYCSEAVVFESVPQSRMSWQWIRRRYMRNGIAIVRSHRKHGESIYGLLLVRMLALVFGATRLAMQYVSRRGPQAQSVESVFKSIGAFCALTGYRIKEYGR